MKISPRYGPEKLAAGRIEDYIDVYEDRMKGWMLDRADEIARHAEGGFAALSVAMGFFEQYWSFLTGLDSNNHAGEFFKKGLLKTFPDLEPGFNMAGIGMPLDFPEKLATFLYKRARNGFFHCGMARSGIAVGDDPSAIKASVELATGNISVVFFNVRVTLATIRRELDTYLAKVRDAGQADARAKFLAAWALNHAGEVIYVPPPEPPTTPDTTPPPSPTVPRA